MVIFPEIFYTGGVYGALGAVLGDQTLIIQSGAIERAEFFTNAWDLIPTGGIPLTARLSDRRYVDSATVTGTASVAAGSSMTVTPSSNNGPGQTITLKNGPFSIPTGVAGLDAGPPSAGHRRQRAERGPWGR